MINPNHTFSAADAAVLSEAGYCIGYDIDGSPVRAMAAHPTTGFIVRSFWNGCSLWHPGLSRMTEKVGSDMAKVLTHTVEISRHPKYTTWMNGSKNFTRLANLRTLALTGNNV